jgi:cephalosporin hydroxylase
MDLLGRGRVYTVDIQDRPKPQHPRIHYRTDSSISEGTLAWLGSEIQPGERVMVTLDSLHTKAHVLAELDRYAPLVARGCYLVVEDSNTSGHPVSVDLDEHGTKEGPWEALEEWLPKHKEFEPDPACEKFRMTFNPGGWLRRI